MKTLKAFFTIIIALFLSFTFNRCTKNCTCMPSASNNSKNVNFFDLNSSSAYYNQVVSTFAFSQATTTYSGCSTCPSLTSNVTLKITNTTNKIIHFDYSITFVLNTASWNYQNVATINPYGTLDLGTINSNPANISLGQVAIQSTSITYQ